MSNPNKQKGTAWESKIVAYLKAHGHPYAERRALAGALDKGDVGGIPGVVIEAKNHKAMALAEWVDEANREKVNAGAPVGVVIFPRRNHSIAKAYVLMDLAQFAELIQ